MSNPSMDSVLTALKTTLSPGGTPVGTLAAIFTRHQDLPYRGLVPALLLPPFGGMSVRHRETARGKSWRGDIVGIYHDATPYQQTLSLAAVEDALVLNIEAIVDAIEQSPTLGGGVAFAGNELAVQPHPDGFLEKDAGTAWIAFMVVIPFIGRVQGGV